MKYFHSEIDINIINLKSRIALVCDILQKEDAFSKDIQNRLKLLFQFYKYCFKYTKSTNKQGTLALLGTILNVIYVYWSKCFSCIFELLFIIDLILWHEFIYRAYKFIFINYFFVFPDVLKRIESNWHICF